MIVDRAKFKIQDTLTIQKMTITNFFTIETIKRTLVSIIKKLIMSLKRSSTCDKSSRSKKNKPVPTAYKQLSATIRQWTMKLENTANLSPSCISVSFMRQVLVDGSPQREALAFITFDKDADKYISSDGALKASYRLESEAEYHEVDPYDSEDTSGCYITPRHSLQDMKQAMTKVKEFVDGLDWDIIRLYLNIDDREDLSCYLSIKK